ncbi:hypothetical protein [Methylobacterium haplocladii]|uniref:Uncharacterized protein n=1 Tax=Methylobacterium haplocladii TaxID=1176176 RepID=A0A512IMI7_9HYPH|nr:hypothetical protein [Methylobacterium haplocladii]GEO98929.1 hypothetical protein MHA02_13170 [Methylobacterium haplocladii]GJD85271.1 hypothetical protein HPGCJGGD_3158 [Methylobacterium haplocladii]GLS58081.1 hypothetical protein GCM10007887_07370 [Methylobacterium haplocladii]
MPYAIVAECQGLTIFNQTRSAAEALELAVARRRTGAASVFVRDEAWTLVPAAALEEAVARDRRHEPTPAPAVTTLTFGNSDTRASSADEAPPVRTGRVRVFKAAGLQRPRS